MQRKIWVSINSVVRIKRTILMSRPYNWERASYDSINMHKGGSRNKSEFSSDGGGGRRGRGRGRHPSGLSGKQIGLWYARKGQEKKAKKELKQRAFVTMNSQHEKRISQLLGELRENESSSNVSDDSRTQPGTSTCRDEYNAPYEEQSDEHYVGGSYNRNGEMQEVTDSRFPDQFADEDDCFPDQVYVSDKDGIKQSTPKYIFNMDMPLKRDSAFDQYLKEEHQKKVMSGSARYIAMQEFRKRLPTYERKEELLQLINSEQVLVISGETGCGKTTQVAQFVLDDAIERGCGSTCRVICTQPRRISAISVAERVAAERDEDCGENGSVGYQIRLESKLPREQGSILYCTTGVLLRWLIDDPLLHRCSHIILDEIHERDILSDFLIIIIRDLLAKRSDLKVILMSATLNSEMFSAYFGNCKMAHIPGFTYPIQEFYLEEIIEKTVYEVREKAAGFVRKEPKWKQYRARGSKSLAKDRRLEKSMAWMAESQLDEKEMEWQQYLHSLRGRYSPRTITTLQNMDLEKIDFDLLVRLITHISLHMEEGAILVFLTGWDDISKLHDNLKKQTLFCSDKFCIIPLHSMMPSTSQREVFDRPPQGVRKIVIATNIAETSITIDDVVFVVDAGKVKQKTYDVNNKIACLQPVWISKASSRQRRGRAGRVQPGYCFHLFTQPRAQSLDDYQLPEMLRTPLEELCLQIKILRLGMIRSFLSKALQPPEEKAVINALEVLRQLNALDADEELTPLGYHLATLPVDPRVGKMILFGAIFSCLDPVLTVASVLGFKDPFVFPLGKQKEAEQARIKFAGDTRSDHLALLNAFQGWEKAALQGSERDYCWRNFLSANTLKMIKDMKKQFSGLLYEIGFLDSTNPMVLSANYNSENLKLVKAILCAGLYPNVAKLEHHRTLKRPPILRTQQDGRVWLHPKSVNAQVTVFEDNWLIYHEKMKSSSLFLYDSTMIAPFPLLFFGGEISVFVEEGYETVAVDDFIKFKSPTRIANLVKELRVELDKLLKQKIAQPEMKLSVGTGAGNKESALLRAIIDLITSEESTNWKKQRALASKSEESYY